MINTRAGPAGDLRTRLLREGKAVGGTGFETSQQDKEQQQVAKHYIMYSFVLRSAALLALWSSAAGLDASAASMDVSATSKDVSAAVRVNSLSNMML